MRLFPPKVFGYFTDLLSKLQNGYIFIWGQSMIVKIVIASLKTLFSMVVQTKDWKISPSITSVRYFSKKKKKIIIISKQEPGQSSDSLSIPRTFPPFFKAVEIQHSCISNFAMCCRRGNYFFPRIIWLQNSLSDQVLTIVSRKLFFKFRNLKLGNSVENRFRIERRKFLGC